MDNTNTATEAMTTDNATTTLNALVEKFPNMTGKRIERVKRAIELGASPEVRGCLDRQARCSRRRDLDGGIVKSITETWAAATTNRMKKGGDLYRRPLTREEMVAPLAWHETQLAVCRRYGVLADGSIGFEVVRS